MHYLVTVNGDPEEAGTSLEEAKELAEKYLSAKCHVAIVNATGSAPTKTWRYVPELGDWVQRGE